MDAGAECILTITALRLRDTVLGRNVTATISTEPSPGLDKTYGGERKKRKEPNKIPEMLFEAAQASKINRKHWA